MLKFPYWGVCGGEIVPDEEHKFQERPEPGCPAMACALGVFAGPKVEVEPQLDQVGDMPGVWIGGGGCRIHDGVDNFQGGGLFMLDWRGAM